MKKENLLRELYQQEIQPVVLFGKEMRILWMNDACVHRFPALAEETDLREFFPDLSLESVSGGSVSSAHILRDRQGKGRMTVIAYPGEPDLFAGIWQDGYGFSPGKESMGPEGVQLMDAWIRQNVFRIFNNLDQLGEYLERAGVSKGEDNLERIERYCQQLLRLGIMMSGCYGPEENGIPVPVEMDSFLEQMFREVDFRLAPIQIVLERTGNSRGAVCMLDKRRFSSALLCLIDLSAGQMPDGGRMRFEISKTRQEFCLNFSDDTTCFSAIAGEQGEMTASEARISENGGFSRLAAQLLGKTVRESGGQCLMTDGKPGLRVSIRLPLADLSSQPAVYDQPAYTVRYQRQARSSLASILLSDLP